CERRENIISFNINTRFIILGFSGNLEMHVLLFMLFLTMYVMSFLGNALISIVIRLDPSLHMPMCYFIASLSLVDILNFLSEDKSIFFVGCAAQLYFLLSLGTTECFLLAAMAYDNFLAICNPLHYPLIMNKQLCACLVAGSWASGILVSLGQTTLIFSLPFCDEHWINYFFCDIPPLLKLACGNICLNEITVFMAGLLITLIPLLLILSSYIFSTCSSHIIVITLFYGSASAMYLRPRSTYAFETDKFLFLLYSIVTPTLNPIIYSWRNKEINDSLKRRFASKLSPYRR
uniref:G-protein coupled receptors family 1 profile domain-containing protein n=1 Tax=Pseudonaja textilis TaxID=8673 RepID=A0A670YUA8_PSETE